MSNEDYSIYDQNITEVNMHDYIKEISVRYGINVSVFRACPVIIDGLTPGQRRRLYTFYMKKAFPNKPRYKANDLLGPVAALHPHGEMSINNSFKNDVKPWESNVQLFDTSGNRGSVAGDPVAATRYLETRLSKYAMKCFFDEFDPEIIDMVLSNTRRDYEPVVIPSKYPNFLFNLSTGIAWGNAIDLPPFNVIEVCKLTIALINNPNMQNVYLYPDSPRGYDIIESDDIASICAGGRGTLTTQSHMILNEDKDGNRYIRVSGFSPQTSMSGIMEKIAKMVINKEISGIDTLADRTYLSDVKFDIILTKEANPEEIIDYLYRKTPLRHYVKINFNFAARTSMQQNIGLKQALLYWIDNRIDVKHRIYTRQAVKLRERISELSGIITMLDDNNRAKTVEIITNSDTDEDSINALVEHYKSLEISSFQANCVLSLGLRKLNRNSKDKFVEEKIKCEKELKKVSSIIMSPKKIKNIIIDELEECAELFGRPRNCEVISQENMKPLTHKYVIVVTKKYIKKLSVNSTGAGVLEPDDEVIQYFPNARGDSIIYIIDNMGKVFLLKVAELKSSSLTEKGEKLSVIAGMQGQSVRAFNVNDRKKIDESLMMVMFLKSGIIKRTPLIQYAGSRKELVGINLNKDDEVTHVVIYSSDNTEHDALIYTEQGLGLVVNLDNITVTDRNTKGSNYLALNDGDTVKGVCDIEDINDNLLVVTSKGYVKFCELDDIFRTAKRRSAMLRITGLSEGDSVFTIIPWREEIRDNCKKITCTLASGQKIDIKPSEIQLTTRLSKGKKMIPCKKGDSLVRIKYN